MLQRVELFSAVPGHMLVAVARLLEEVSYEAGTTIIERGAVEDWLYVVAEGRVRIHIGDRTLGEAAKGDVVGEFAVLASGAPLGLGDRHRTEPSAAPAARAVRGAPRRSARDRPRGDRARWCGCSRPSNGDGESAAGL